MFIVSFFNTAKKRFSWNISFADVEIVEAFYPFWLDLYTLGNLPKCKSLFQVY